jgi:prepilin-type processing-associated H-X9-DG protein
MCWILQVGSVTITKIPAPTYGIITSRSYHTGLVNVVLMDGSVRVVASSIELATWRALGTRDGSEVIGEF